MARFYDIEGDNFARVTSILDMLSKPALYNFFGKWGIKKAREDKEEYSFKASKAGDVTDDEFWSYITSPDFAVELIESYKRGGKAAVANWVKNGCA